MDQRGGIAGDGPDRRQRMLLVVFALLAAVRVALLAGSMPVFAHLDEDTHFDNVHKYARGAWPKLGQDRYDREVAELGARFQSGEWHAALVGDPRTWVLPGVMLDPILRARNPAAIELAADPDTLAKVQQMVDARIDWSIERSPNYESYEPPAYYLVASTWLRVGRWFGVRGVGELAWVRMLGVLIAAGAVFATWALGRLAVPREPRVALGAAGLIAVLGQDIVACVSNDAPGVLTGPLVLLVAAFLAQRPRSVPVAILAGMAIALPVVTKLTVVHASVAAFVLLFVAYRFDLKRWWPVLLGAALPVVAWIAYARINLGMWHGGEHKIELTLLAPQTWDGLWSHPMFTVGGLATFFGDCLLRLWRGGLWFHGHELSFVASDAVYLLATLVGVLALLRNREPSFRTPPAPAAGLASGVIGAILLMAAISLMWNFDHARWPTKEYPYFTQGRMTSACLPSLTVLIALGLIRAFGRRAGVLAIGAIALVALISETWLDLPIYQSPHALWRLW